ncbi:11429_t:CDS:1, partial [Racocetra persica]
ANPISDSTHGAYFDDYDPLIDKISSHFTRYTLSTSWLTSLQPR